MRTTSGLQLWPVGTAEGAGTDIPALELDWSETSDATVVRPLADRDAPRSRSRQANDAAPKSRSSRQLTSGPPEADDIDVKCRLGRSHLSLGASSCTFLAGLRRRPCHNASRRRARRAFAWPPLRQPRARKPRRTDVAHEDFKLLLASALNPARFSESEC
jgi:hypothetical protein